AAGVENRVYFRVRAPLGQAADLVGKIRDQEGRDVVSVRTDDSARPARNVGLGVFSIAPQPGKTYRLHISSPGGVKEAPALPAVQDARGALGLALSVPAGVIQAGKPIRAVLQHKAPAERSLVVGVYSHDRLVAQEAVAAKAGTTAVELNPAPAVG